MKLDTMEWTTESRNPATMHLDEMDALSIVQVMNAEDAKVAGAITPVLPKIAKVVDLAVEAFGKGGRLLYLGAGTSGRLGVLDASECPPTFGVPSGMVVGIIAGGADALVRSAEGKEDNSALAKADLQREGLRREDLVVGLAASGRTPYVYGGLQYASALGCHTASISCNVDSPIGKVAEVAIEVPVGPEVLTGSTRLKAGTAQKMILNMISTASMVRLGKAYENLMVDVVQSNEKLKVRGENIVMEATGVERQQAREMLALSSGSAKLAITAILGGFSIEEAKERLEACMGHVREAIQG